MDTLDKLAELIQNEIDYTRPDASSHPDDTFNRGKIAGLEWALSALRDTKADEPQQWGYGHEKAHDAISWPELGRPAWYATKKEAEKALESDLRWNIPTFLVRRSAPGQMVRAGEDTFPSTKYHASLTSES